MEFSVTLVKGFDSNPQFYMYVIILRQKCVTEVKDFKLFSLEKPVLETALAALNNLREDKIKISNEYLNYRWYSLQS